MADQNVRDFNSVENQLKDLKSKFHSMKVLKLEKDKNYFNKIEAGRKHLLVSVSLKHPCKNKYDHVLEIFNLQLLNCFFEEFCSYSQRQFWVKLAYPIGHSHSCVMNTLLRVKI